MKRLPVFVFIVVLVALIVSGGSTSALPSRLGVQTATPSDNSLPSKPPVIHASYKGANSDGVLSGSCWPPAKPTDQPCNYAPDAQPTTAIKVANGDQISFALDVTTPAPTQFTAILPDDMDATGKPRQVDLTTTNLIFKVDNLTPGQHSLQVQASYPGDTPDSNFVEYTFTLDVQPGTGVAALPSAAATGIATMSATATSPATQIATINATSNPTQAPTIAVTASPTVETTVVPTVPATVPATPTATQPAPTVAATTEVPTQAPTEVLTESATQPVVITATLLMSPTTESTVATQEVTIQASATTTPTMAATIQVTSTVTATDTTLPTVTQLPTITQSATPTLTSTFTLAPVQQVTNTFTPTATATLTMTLPSATPTNTATTTPLPNGVTVTPLIISLNGIGNANLAPDLILHIGNQDYNPIALTATLLNSTGLPISITKPMTANAERVIAPRGSVAQISFNGPRPVSVQANLLSADGSTQVNTQTLVADNLVSYTIPATPGTYLLSIDIVWPAGQAIYYYRVTVN